MKIAITRTSSHRPSPDESDLGFGRHFSDHMFVMDFDPAEGWQNARVVPYGPFSMEPANLTLHYGQAIFEGMKVSLPASTMMLMNSGKFFQTYWWAIGLVVLA